MEENPVKQLIKLRAALERRDIVQLKFLAGQFAAMALEKEDPHCVDLTVLAYSTAKFLEKPYIVDTPEWKVFIKHALDVLAEAQASPAKATLEDYHEKVSSLIGEVEALHRSLGKFVTNVVDKARIKAATQMYAHGASLSRAAEMAKTNKREVAAYIGTTHLPEKYRTISVRRRLELAEQYFSDKG